MVFRRGKSGVRHRLPAGLAAGKRCQRLWMACPDPVLLKDADGLWQDMNQSARDLLGVGQTNAWRHLTDQEVTLRYPHLAGRFAARQGRHPVEQATVPDEKGTIHTLRIRTTPCCRAGEHPPCLAAPATETDPVPKSVESLFQSLKELEAIVDATDTAIWQIDRNRHFLRVNRTASEWMGRPRTEIAGRPDQQFRLCQTDQWRQETQQVLKSHIARRGSAETLELASGRILEVEVDRVPYWQGQELAGLVVLARDVTQHSRTERALQRSEERYRNILDEIQDGYFEVDLAGNLTFFNPALTAILGYPAEEMYGLNDRRYTDAENAKSLYHAFNHVYRTGQSVMAECQIIRKDGTRRYLNASVSLMVGAEHQPIGFRGLTRDITEHKEVELELRYMAHHDTLTALPNRTHLVSQLTSAIREAEQCQQTLALLFIDLDRFKNINDTLGHPAGDHLLQGVADTLQNEIRQGDIVARTGGDEFAVLLRPLTRPEDVDTIATRILQRLQHPWQIKGQEFRCPGSIGIAIYPHDGKDPDTLLKNADVAMYRAKNAGGNRYVLYSADMNRQSSDYVLLENELNQAIEHHDFLVYYQPQVNSATGLIHGAEALVRWNRPGVGLIPPGDFIPFAELSGLIIPIGQQVFSLACRQTARWLNSEVLLPKVAVNLSARQFQQSNIQSMIMRILENTNLPPDRLEIEITESAAMDNVSYTLRLLKIFRSMGMAIALDDFGTGFSSLRYLKDFPITSLKIDQSFVQDVLYEPKSRAIVKTVIELAKNLGFDVIAEGAETQPQVDALRDLGCDVIQGYHFSRPLPPDQFEQYVLTHSPQASGT